MKLSKQERIGVLIILVVVIIAVGVFVFIVPAVQEIEVTMKNLDNKQSEYDAAVAKAARKGPLKTQILDEYEAGEHIADMFFPEMKSYEAENAAREFLMQCESNIVVTSMEVSNPSTATLSTNFPSEKVVSYSLKENATQGAEQDEATLKRQTRIAELRNALGSSQTIGASTVSFRVRAASQEELTKFVDEINNYFKDENGVSTRKAVMLSSAYTVSYADVSTKYNTYLEVLANMAEEIGQAAIDAGEDGEFTYEVPNLEDELPDEDGEEGESNISTNYKTMEVTLVFYSIERMQDPSPQLDAQDGIVPEDDAA